MGEHSGQFWSQLRPLLLWNLTLVPAMVLFLVFTQFHFMPTLLPTMLLLVIVGCLAALAAHAATLPVNQTPRGRRGIAVVVGVSLAIAGLALVVVALFFPAQSLAPLALVLGLAWLPGAVGTAYNLWVRRAGEPA
ncbi:MAG: hypothetical protein ACO1N6_10300 [Microcella sp.]